MLNTELRLFPVGLPRMWWGNPLLALTPDPQAPECPLGIAPKWGCWGVGGTFIQHCPLTWPWTFAFGVPQNVHDNEEGREGEQAAFELHWPVSRLAQAAGEPEPRGPVCDPI